MRAKIGSFALSSYAVSLWKFHLLLAQKFQFSFQGWFEKKSGEIVVLIELSSLCS